MPIPALAPIFAALARSLASVTPALASSMTANASATAAFQAIMRNGMRAPAVQAVGNAATATQTAQQATQAQRTQGPQPPQPQQPTAPPVWQPQPQQGQSPQTNGTGQSLQTSILRGIGSAIGGIAKQGLNNALPMAQYSKLTADAGESVGRYIHDFAVATRKATFPLAELGERFKRFGDQIIEQQRELSQFSDRQAVSFAKLDAARENMSIRRAEKTAASSDYAIRNQIALEKALEPMVTATTNMSNYITGTFTGGLAKIIDFLGIISAGALNSMSEDARKDALAKKETEKKSETIDGSLVDMLQQLAAMSGSAGRLRPPLTSMPGTRRRH